MILHLTFLFSVAAAATELHLYNYLTNLAEHKSHYVADYSRIDWQLCEEDGGNNGNIGSFCLINLGCAPDERPAEWRAFKTSDLHQKKDCGSGIQIKAITPSKWLFFIQIFAPSLDHSKGVMWHAEYKVDKEKPFPIVTCKYDGNGKAWIEKGLEGIDHGLEFKMRDTSYSSDEGMMCIFEITAKDVAAELKAILSTDLIKDSNLRITVVRNGRPFPVEYKEKSLHNTIEIIEKTSKRMVMNTPLPSHAKLSSFRRDFVFTEPIKDFPTLACADHHARLVVENPEGVLREVVKDNFLPYTDPYYFVAGYQTAKPQSYLPTIIKKVSEEGEDAVAVACATRTCHHCALPLPVRDCDGCVPYSVQHPANHKDCPVLRCPGNMWMLDDAVTVRRVHETGGIRCAQNNGEFGWYRISNGQNVVRASCTVERDCVKMSPLNITCSGDKTNCVKIARGVANCPNGLTLASRKMKINIPDTKPPDEWKALSTPLHCDWRLGTWYSGDNEEFNHTTHGLKCEEISEDLFVLSEKWTRGGFLVAFFGSIVGGLFLALLGGCVSYWYNRTREKARLKHLMTRPKTEYKTIFDDLAAVKLMPKLDKPVFFAVIQEFQLYSIHERIEFVDYCVQDLGVRVELNQFLCLFNHCTEMESDGRVWKLLQFGYKYILVALNQVNRSRVALKLMERLKIQAGNLLDRIGFEKVYGDDEYLIETRNIALHLLLITNCQKTSQHVLEESVLYRGCEDISRRKMIFGFRARAANLQGEKYKEWVVTCGESHDENDYAHMDMVNKYGAYREHLLYGLCCGKEPEMVSQILQRAIDMKFTRKELLAGFTAAIEDCYDMRFGAREAFMKVHKKLKDIMPPGCAEYNEIFRMFARYANLEYGCEDGWMVKWVYSIEAYTADEKAKLPVNLISQGSEYSRFLLKKAQQFELPLVDPPHEPAGVNPASDKSGKSGKSKLLVPPRTDPNAAADPKSAPPGAAATATNSSMQRTGGASGTGVTDSNFSSSGPKQAEENGPK